MLQFLRKAVPSNLLQVLHYCLIACSPQIVTESSNYLLSNSAWKVIRCWFHQEYLLGQCNSYWRTEVIGLSYVLLNIVDITSVYSISLVSQLLRLFLPALFEIFQSSLLFLLSSYRSAHTLMKIIKFELNWSIFCSGYTLYP